MPSPDDFYDEAVDRIAAGDPDGAVEKYRAAIALDPNFADAWEGLSMALADLERWDDAVVAAKKVVELTPDEQLAYTNLSRIYQRAGDIPEAEAWAAQGRVLEWKRQLKNDA